VSKVEVEASKPNIMTACGTGTTMYRAPEVHPKANPNSKGIEKVNSLKADAFSFAMICAHLLSLETPFQDLEHPQCNRYTGPLNDSLTFESFIIRT
jgi:hypothetical protein